MGDPRQDDECPDLVSECRDELDRELVPVDEDDVEAEIDEEMELLKKPPCNERSAKRELLEQPLDEEVE
jgi:hypothetical protein